SSIGTVSSGRSSMSWPAPSFQSSSSCQDRAPGSSGGSGGAIMAMHRVTPLAIEFPALAAGGAVVLVGGDDLEEAVEATEVDWGVGPEVDHHLVVGRRRIAAGEQHGGFGGE